MDMQRASYFKHFLPKFDNQSTSALLGGTVDAAADGCLMVSKKHSGSLVMAPPFFSKNGTGNEFSRMGAFLVREYFRVVWSDAPQGADERFSAWWADAEGRGLCYSFEAVVPRLLGDHGATPAGAYAVLTAITSVDDGRVLSPVEVLEVATRWRLPLNEAWFVAPGGASRVEHALREARWSLLDGDCDVLFAEKCAGQPCFKQGFWRHGEVQGDILEGFVLLALSNVDMARLEALIDAYEKTVGLHRELASRVALDLGRRCLAGDATVAALIESAVDGCPEPTRVQVPRRALWSRLTAHVTPTSLGATPIERLFGLLGTCYRSRVAPSLTSYNGKLLVQVNVVNDHIFFGWGKLHAPGLGCAPLFRGLVIAFPGADGDAQASADAPAENEGRAGPAAAGAACRVVAIAKLKCLAYLARTFGVRNLLNTLLDHGPREYLVQVDRFMATWGAPADRQGALRATLARWAEYVAALAPPDRERLRASYLPFLEPFLEGKAPTFEATSALAKHSVVVVNLTGEPLGDAWRQAFAHLGLSEGTTKRAGVWAESDRPVGASWLSKSGAPFVVMVLPPWPAGAPTSDGPAGCDGHQALVLAKKYEAMRRVSAKDLGIRELWFLDPGATAQDMHARAMTLGTALHEPEPVDAPRPGVHVVAILCLPPGGGKSSLCAELALRGCTVVSSDQCQASGERFETRLHSALKAGGCVVVDKNVPNLDGLRNLVRALHRSENSLGIDVWLHTVVPEELGAAQADVCLTRLRGRPADHVGLTPAVEGGDEGMRSIFRRHFFEPSVAFRACAAALPGAITTPAFFAEDSAGLAEVADAVLSECSSADAGETELCSATHVLAAADLSIPAPGGGPTRSRSRANWASATLLHLDHLHVTLVPPVSAQDDDSSGGRVALLERLCDWIDAEVSVELIAFYIARNAEDELCAFWEVGRVAGLPVELIYPPQRTILHVTDTASLTNGVRPRQAAELLRLVKAGCRAEEGGGGGTVPAEREVGGWTVRRYTLPMAPLMVSARICLH